MNYLCHSLQLSCAGCNHPATHTHTHTHTHEQHRDLSSVSIVSMMLRVTHENALLSCGSSVNNAQRSGGLAHRRGGGGGGGAGVARVACHGGVTADQTQGTASSTSDD